MNDHTIEFSQWRGIPGAKELKASDCTSYWVKETIDRLEKRDPVDALKDLELLMCITINRIEIYKSVDQAISRLNASQRPKPE